MVLKAHQQAIFMHHCFLSCDISLLWCAYLVYVRPLVEYNSVIWSPILVKDFETVARIQRYFAKRLLGFENLAYVDR